MNIQQAIGKQIRMYRKLQKLSLEDLASKIYKSKSIVSKYELGQSNMDVATLYEIAAALKVSVRHLLDIPEEADSDSVSSDSQKRFGIFTENLLYLYIMECDRKKPIFHRGIITLTNEKSGAVFCTLYMDAEDIHNYTRCKQIYQGKLSCTPYNATIAMNGVLTPDEHLTLFASINRSCRDMVPGFYSSYSLVDNVPCSTNLILSRFPLVEDEQLKISLAISKDKINQLKHGNVYVGNDFIDEGSLHREEQPAAAAERNSAVRR